MLHPRNVDRRFPLRASRTLMMLVLLAALASCGRNVQVAATSGELAIWSSPAEAEVTLIDPWGRSVDPVSEAGESEGELRFRAGGGVFKLLAEAEGYAALDEAFDLPEEAAMRVDLALEPLEDEKSDVSTSNLIVRSSLSGMAVEVVGDGDVHQLVVVDGESEDGAVAETRFRVDPGDYVVTARAEGHEAFEASIAVEEGAPVEVAAVFEPVQEDPREEEPDEEAPGSGDEGSDGSKDGGSGGSDDVPEEDEEAGGADRGFSLRGDPSFSKSDLTSAQRDWYDLVWAAIRNPDARPNPDRLALSDDLYEYGRTLHTHIQTLLLLLRVTGDLALLDEVDRLAELMRSQLSDPWRDTLDGTDGTRDGYLNWVHRYGDYEEFEGKDNHKTNALKAHAMVASIAYALEVNRDFESPGGRDYAASADAWRDYLLNHFEPKWRERLRISSGYPYLNRPHMHTYVSQMKYYYYMGQLSGDSLAVAEAERQADVLWDLEFRTVDTDAGDGTLWPRSILSECECDFDYLHPTTYARYVYLDFIEFHFEGFHRWKNADELGRVANTFADFVIDRGSASDDDWFTGDIGGDEARAGFRSDGWARMNVSQYAQSGYAMITPWDASGRVGEINVRALDELGERTQPRSVPVVAGMFLDTYLPDALP